VRVYPPVSLRLPSAVLPALLKRQLTISRTSAEFMQAYRKDTDGQIAPWQPHRCGQSVGHQPLNPVAAIEGISDRGVAAGQLLPQLRHFD
ncbi:MAG: hypothetical protein ACREYE_19345, partial [Gammaproteobacteria bacterium]